MRCDEMCKVRMKVSVGPGRIAKQRTGQEKDEYTKMIEGGKGIVDKRMGNKNMCKHQPTHLSEKALTTASSLFYNHRLD